MGSSADLPGRFATVQVRFRQRRLMQSDLTRWHRGRTALPIICQFRSALKLVLAYEVTRLVGSSADARSSRAKQSSKLTC